MRHVVYIALALAALCLATACHHETMPDAPQNGLRKMIVHASQADTRTYVEYDPTEERWFSYWSGDDEIDLFGFSGDDYYLGYSEQSLVEEEGRNATFSVTFYDGAPLSGGSQYVGAYPRENADAINSDDPRWINAWGSSSPLRWGLIGNIDCEQHPAPLGFDRKNDLMVSKMTGDVELTTEDFYPVGDVSLAFARVGSIAKITLRGLTPDEILWGGTFSHGSGWQSTGDVIYDPVAEKIAVLPAQATEISFWPDGQILVDEHGEAVIWLRVLSGTLSDHFTISVETSDDMYGQEENTIYSKTVTLESPITFTEGNITAFTVRLNKVL